MSFITRLSLIPFIVLFGAGAVGAESVAGVVAPRPKIGLALSGGGARGAAHIGVIRVLEELRIPVDYIAGTSMGAIVGGLYASGLSIDELENVLTGIDWKVALNDLPPRQYRPLRRKRDDEVYLVRKRPGLKGKKLVFPSGLILGQNIDLIFKAHTLSVGHIRDFDRLSIPFRAVATDIVTGEAVVLGSGDLALAMRASMSVPGGFSPVEIDGRLLVDGGVSNNLPIDVVRAMGADIVIAVDISTPLKGREEITSVLSVTAQLAGILTRRNTEEQIRSLTDRDLLILPDLGDIGTTDFDEAGEAIPKGVAAANAVRPDLVRLALSGSDYARYRRPRAAPENGPPIIEFVRINNDSKLGDEALAARLRIEIGKPLDVVALEDGIQRIYGLELFSNVRYDVVEEDGRTGVVIDAKAREWGPNYIQFGLAMSTNTGGDSFFNFGVAYTRTAINALGGEWRSAIQIGEDPLVFTEIYQPLDYAHDWFITPKLLYQSRSVNEFDSGRNQVAEFRLQGGGGSLALGRNFGIWGDLRVGLKRISGDVEVRVGDPALSDTNFDSGELFVRFAVDTLDNRNFPGDGLFGKLEWVASREEVGADLDYDQILFDAGVARTWGLNTFIASAQFDATLDDDAPVQGLFRTGGFLSLSGFQQNELSGQHVGLFRIAYLRRLYTIRLLTIYAGGSIEAGNVWQDRDDVAFGDSIGAASAFIGVDSVLGPLYVGYGRNTSGEGSAYLFLGRVF